MRVGVITENSPREHRVALTPTGVTALAQSGASVVVEAGAGISAGFPDDEYAAAGATVADRDEALSADVVVALHAGSADLSTSVGPGQLVVSFLDPIWDPSHALALGATGADLMALELVPRVTRAQTMDVLSSVATVVGYEAVLLAAHHLPRIFPMMMTAAGTLPAARALVLGAGVAGLQAIATARRLGAVVEAYDVRPAAAEQIRSLGARALELDLDTSDSEGAGGYAKAQTDEKNRRQRELLASHVAGADVVITTAAVPGRRSPLLVTRAMVEAMTPGSVVVDLAAERGGNCEPTVADEVVRVDGVTVLGPTDLASWSAASSSQMVSTNIVNLLVYLASDGEVRLDRDDEIIAAMLVATGGEIVHPDVVAAAATTRSA